MQNKKIYKMAFADVYPFYIQKAEKKVDFETFFNNAPQLNPNASKITGIICGYRIENIEDELMKKIRYLDKLIDELAKGKSMEKILRK